MYNIYFIIISSLYKKSSFPTLFSLVNKILFAMLKHFVNGHLYGKLCGHVSHRINKAGGIHLLNGHF